MKSGGDIAGIASMPIFICFEFCVLMVHIAD